MGNLSKWIEDKKTADINSTEYDITTNEGMKELFFSQIEDLDFDYEIKDDDNLFIYVRLTYPNNEFKPFKFLLDTKKIIITPQYTKTHRALIVDVGSAEYETLKNLITYIDDDYIRRKVKDLKRVIVEPPRIAKETTRLEYRVSGEYVRGGVEFIFDGGLKFNGTEKVTIFYKNEPLFISNVLVKDQDISFNAIPPNDIGVRHMYTRENNNSLEIVIFAEIFNNEGVTNFSAEIDETL